LDPAEVKQIESIDENWCFFQMQDHGVDLALRGELFRPMAQFFQLPLDIKQ